MLLNVTCSWSSKYDLSNIKSNSPKQPMPVIFTNTFFLSGIDVAFKTMSASFVNLDIPHAYALLFYLAIFLAGLMFLVSSYLF